MLAVRLSEARKFASDPGRCSHSRPSGIFGSERGVARIEVDGQPLSDNQSQIPLSDDGVTHQVRVVLGEPMRTAADVLAATSSAASGQK